MAHPVQTFDFFTLVRLLPTLFVGFKVQNVDLVTCETVMN